MQGQRPGLEKSNMSVKATVKKVDIEEREITVEGFVLKENRKLTTITEGLYSEDGNPASAIEQTRSIKNELINNITKGMEILKQVIVYRYLLSKMSYLRLLSPSCRNSKDLKNLIENILKNLVLKFFHSLILGL